MNENALKGNTVDKTDHVGVLAKDVYTGNSKDCISNKWKHNTSQCWKLELISNLKQNEILGVIHFNDSKFIAYNAWNEN